MRRVDGQSLLVISVCCCIFVSLGYVNLCRGITKKVNDPRTAEFWQIRDLALKVRNPATEAREAFASGKLNAFNLDSLTDPSDHEVVEFTRFEKPKVTLSATRANFFGRGFLRGNQDVVEQLSGSHNKFVNSSTEFALGYNRELTRLMNRR